MAEAGATPVAVGSPPPAGTDGPPPPTMGLCCPGPVCGWTGCWCWTGVPPVWAGLVVVVWALPCNGRGVICCSGLGAEPAGGGGSPGIPVNILSKYKHATMSSTLQIKITDYNIKGHD